MGTLVLNVEGTWGPGSDTFTFDDEPLVLTPSISNLDWSILRSFTEDLTLTDSEDADWKLYLKLDETSGTLAIDESQYRNTGTLLPEAGDGVWCLGLKSARFLSFDGIDDYVQIGDDPSLDQSEMTIEAWVNFGAYNNSMNPYVLGKIPDYAGYAIYWGSSSGDYRYVVSRCYIIDGSTTPVDLVGLVIADAKWHFLTFSFKSGEQKLYIDGTLADSSTVTGTIATNTNPLMLGTNETTYAKMYLDSVFIRGRVLSEAEVSDRYNLTLSEHNDTLTESITHIDSLSFQLSRSFTEAITTVDSIFKIPQKLRQEITSLIDVLTFYHSVGTEEIGIKIYRNNTPVTVDNNEILTAEIRTGINEHVGEAYVVFDNDPIKDYREGDAIEISWATKGIFTRIFSGQVESANKIGKTDNEEERLELRCKGWGKILLEQKVTVSYPTVTNIKTMIQELLTNAGVTTAADPPSPCQSEINIDYIYDYVGTRTLDFVGEPLWDCLRKIAEVTQSDFYIDPYKRLRFFPRNYTGSGFTWYGGAAGGSLNSDNIDSYEFEIKTDQIANHVKAYGYPNKADPTDLDSYSEAISPYWSTEFYGTTISLDTTNKKAGDASILFQGAGAAGATVTLGMTCDFGEDNEYDLTTKEAYTKLKWANRIYVPAAATTVYVKDLKIFLRDSENHAVQYDSKIYPDIDRGTLNTASFPEQEVPVGPQAEADGQWIDADNVSWVVSTSLEQAVSSYPGGYTGGTYTTNGASPWLGEIDEAYIRIGELLVGGHMGAFDFANVGTFYVDWTPTECSLSTWSKKYGGNNCQGETFLQLPAYYTYFNSIGTTVDVITSSTMFYTYGSSPWLNTDDGDTSYRRVANYWYTNELKISAFTGDWNQWEAQPSISSKVSCLVDDDDDAKCIKTNTVGMLDSWYSFTDLPSTNRTIYAVSLHVICKGVQQGIQPGRCTIAIGIDIDNDDGEDGEYKITIERWDLDWTDKEINLISLLDTPTKINNARINIYFESREQGFNQSMPYITCVYLDVQSYKTPVGFYETYSFSNLSSIYSTTPITACFLRIKAKNVIMDGDGAAISLSGSINTGSGWESAGSDLTWNTADTSYTVYQWDITSLIGTYTKFNNAQMKIECKTCPAGPNESQLYITYAYLYAEGLGKSIDQWSENNSDWTERKVNLGDSGTLPAAYQLTTLTKINNARVVYRAHDIASGSDKMDITKSALLISLEKSYGLTFTPGTFDWSSIRKISWVVSIYRDDSSTVYANIDWLHFDEGKWFGEYDYYSTAPVAYQVQYGERFVEIFDETMYSDDAAYRRAYEHVQTYKDSIPVVLNVITDKIGAESLNPGDVTSFILPERGGTINIRVKDLRFFFDGEEDQYIQFDAQKV